MVHTVTHVIGVLLALGALYLAVLAGYALVESIRYCIRRPKRAWYHANKIAVVARLSLFTLLDAAFIAVSLIIIVTTFNL